MTTKVRKAVFPVAGMGTRFLPATKANPKEMLPVVDKPLIQFAAEEAVEAGITELIFVTGRNKRSIPDHFDKAYELEAELVAKHKDELLKRVENILPANVSCIYTRQSEALGLGHAVLCAANIVGNEPFAVILADDLIDNPDNGCLKQMTELFSETGNSILGVEQVDAEDTNKYGIVDTTSNPEHKHSELTGIVEKPAPQDAPSNLAVVGRYILTPRIFELLETVQAGQGGEIQLTDAISKLLAYERILAYRYEGERYDCGSKLGYLKATVELGLKHPEVADEFKAYLKELSIK